MDLRSALALDPAPGAIFEPLADRRDPRRYAARDKSRDGTFVRIRAIRPDDRERLDALTTGEGAAGVVVDRDGHVGVVATVWIEGSERMVGWASLAVEPWSEPRRAQVVLTVLHAWQGRGIGSLLFAHILRVARQCGIDEIHGRVQESNPRMLRIVGESRLPREIERKGTELRVSLRLQP